MFEGITKNLNRWVEYYQETFKDEEEDNNIQDHKNEDARTETEGTLTGQEVRDIIKMFKKNKAPDEN